MRKKAIRVNFISMEADDVTVEGVVEDGLMFEADEVGLELGLEEDV